MTDQSNVQKMHIPQEWFRIACEEYLLNADDGFDADGLRAALAAVIPLERERLAKEAEEGIMVRAQISSEEFCAADAGHDVADWLRAQGRE